MDVYEAVTSRRAVRGFTDEPVSREVLERVLSAAAWSLPDRTFNRGTATC
jgi:nitroreductase